jgi:hypothetical protein
MAYVIYEPCVGARVSSCVHVDRTRPTPDARIEACPVDAIARESIVSAEWWHFVGGNAGHYRSEP